MLDWFDELQPRVPVHQSLVEHVFEVPNRGSHELHQVGFRRTAVAAQSDPDDLWFDAGDLGFALARQGVTVKTLDLLIATYALAPGAPLLTLDRNFRTMWEAGVPLALA